MITEGLLKQVLVEQRDFIKPSPGYIEREFLRDISAFHKLPI